MNITDDVTMKVPVPPSSALFMSFWGYFWSDLGEKSACHARLVHTLLSEFHGGQSDWLGKYPSKRYVPKVSRRRAYFETLSQLADICLFSSHIRTLF